MKKFLLLLMMFSISLNAQDKLNEKTVYDDSKNAISTVYNDVKSLSPKVEESIKILAEQFKTTTTELWSILVKQQLVWSWCFLILTISALFNWWLFYKRNLNSKLTENDFIKGRETYSTDEKNPEYYVYEKDIKSSRYHKYLQAERDILLPLENTNNKWFKHLHLVICLGLSGFSFYHFSDMLTGFINPEYGALKTIVEITSNLK
jgi:hypothetical protein